MVHRATEAGQYLSTFKSSEHRSPDLIKERIDKDYNAILRSALTSINKVNKMDVETLRASFGVSLAPLLVYFWFLFRRVLKLTMFSFSYEVIFGNIKNKLGRFATSSWIWAYKISADKRCIREAV